MSSLTDYEKLKEIQNAIDIGKEVYFCLRRAETHLEKASNWSLGHLVIRFALIGYQKHKYIEKANQEVEAARYLLMQFEKGLAAMVFPPDIHININNLAKIGDIWLGNPLLDAYVQEKINKANEQVTSVRIQVKEVLMELKKYRELERSVIDEVDADIIDV